MRLLSRTVARVLIAGCVASFTQQVAWTDPEAPPAAITLADAARSPVLKLDWSGNSRDQLTLSVHNEGRNPATIRIPAGLICSGKNGDQVAVLREAPVTVPANSTVDAQIPTAALSSKNSTATQLFSTVSQTEPRLSALLRTLATRVEIPRTTAQLLVLAILEDISFRQWEQFASPSPKAEVTPPESGRAALEVAQAVDALGILRQLAPERAFALGSDTELKVKALHNPVCRAKALELYGMKIPGEPPAAGQEAPNLGQLLHTKAGDNCPICRMRQQMDRAASDF